MARKKPRYTLTDYIHDKRTTASAVAAELGISRQFFSEIRSGKRTPSLVVAVRIEDLTGIPPRSFVAAQTAQ